MKIKYIKGDLFDTDIEVIVHGCNAQGVMGSGVAKIIRDRYNKAYDRYRKEYKLHGHLNLGDIITARGDDGKVIINAITQEFYGRDGKRYVSYDALADAMKKINRFNEVYGVSDIAMPMIGAGLGGGDWSVIEAIIESELTDIQPYVYSL